MFRPTTLPFQLQSNEASHWEPDCWVPLTGHKYATVQEADDALVALRTARDGGPTLRVYCDPGDVARALYEAGIAIRGLCQERDLAVALGNGFSAALMELECKVEAGK